MSALARVSQILSSRLAAPVIIVLGAALGLTVYHVSRGDERRRAELEFTRRASLRQTLTREILDRYEDALFGLATLFKIDGDLSRSEFVRAAERVEQRVPAARAFEWVPLVTEDDRAAHEAAMARAFPGTGFQIHRIDQNGRRVRSSGQSVYYPINYIHPLQGNEAALGYDVTSAATMPFLEQARTSGHLVVTAPFRLVQERSDQLSVIMISPVYRSRGEDTGTSTSEVNAARGAPLAAAVARTEAFAGFVQCVFDVHDLLEKVLSPQPDAGLDMLFVDASEPDPSKRLLYYRPADEAARVAGVASTPTEKELRAGLSREIPLPFGGRDWRVIYRPRRGWIESLETSTPFLRGCGLMLLAAMLAGLVQLSVRRTDMVKREVHERTVELAESRRQLAGLLHALPGMAYRCKYDEQMTVLFVSEGARALTGWAAGDLTGGAVHFRELIHPDDLERVRDATRAALQDRADIEVEYRIRTRTGAEKWVLSRGRGIYGADGRLASFEGLAIDITAQKEAERIRLALERKLLEGQKLESLGLLAGGIAHDFNNLLSTIMGNAGMGRLSAPAGSPLDDQFSAIETAGLRAAELCRQMLAYAGKGRFVIGPTDLTALTEELLPLLRVSIQRHASLELALSRDLPAVMADGTQLRQIVMNLVLNAADAIGDGEGEIAVSTGVGQITTAALERCVIGKGLPPGEYVYFEVRDTGCGMEPATLARIFDPFFTTKFAGRGLGLAAVLGIVRGHRGALEVESAIGRGSRFRLMLPATRASAPSATPPASAQSGRWRHEGRVLVIEDEDAVRGVLTQTVQSFGLSARDAANGTEGLTLFRAAPSTFDLVMLDLLMPGLDGEQTLAGLRALKPDVKVLLVSGYSEGDVLRRLAGPGRLAFLAKPFTRDGLEKKLRELLA